VEDASPAQGRLAFLIRPDFHKDFLGVCWLEEILDRNRCRGLNEASRRFGEAV